MAEQLFEVNKDYEVLLNPNAIKIAGGSLKNISQKDLMYIILAYDYRTSKFKLFPQSEMIKMARKEVFKGKPNYIPEDDELMAKRISEYVSLIYDENRETKKNLQNKLVALRRSLSIDDLTPQRMKDVSTSIKFLTQEIEDIDAIIKKNDEKLILKGKNTKLSMIEIWQRRVKRSKEMQA